MRNEDSIVDEARRAAADLTTLNGDVLLRGIGINKALHGFGMLFKQATGSASTYNLSETVESLCIFLSHTWSTPRSWKFLTLSLQFNTVVALIGLISCDIVVWALFATERLQWLRGTLFVLNLLFPLLVVVSHEARRYVGLKGPMLFVDKACIHQVDPHLKQLGIANLGAFLLRSSRMLIIYNDEYLKKLWTVYEVATVLTANPDAKIEVLPIFLTKAVVAHYTVWLCWWLLFMWTDDINESFGAASEDRPLRPFLLIWTFGWWCVYFVGAWAAVRYWAKKAQRDVRSCRSV
jgi:hypothetical protein